MLRVNKVSEYGVLALGYIGTQTNAQSARDVASALSLPYEITAKTLQKLKDAGFVASTKGAHGGYKLVSALSDISFAQVVDAMEGPIAMADCMTASEVNGCERHSFCGLKHGMNKINQRVQQLLHSVKLNELVNQEGVK